jgi:membrane protein
MKKSYSTLAGAIAFFLVINGGSLLYLMITIANLFNINIDFGNNVLGEAIIEISKNTGYTSSIIFFLTSIYSASTLFFHMIKTGEMVYEELNTRFNLLKRLIAVIFLCAFVFIIETFFVILILSKSIFNNILWKIFRYIGFISVSYAVALCIIFFITPHRVRYHEIKRGAFLATILWFLVTILFTLFLSVVTDYKAIYGALTFYVVFMIWIYLLAQGLVCGVVYNYYHHLKIDSLMYLDGNKLQMAHQKEDYEKESTNHIDVSDQHFDDQKRE